MLSRTRLRRGAVAAGLAVAALATATTLPAAAAPGDLDTTFSGDGVIVTSRGSVPVTADAVEVEELSDGRLLVASNVAGSAIAVTRLLADGRIDTSFGTRGSTILSPGFPTLMSAMVVRPDGSIVVAGALGRIITNRPSALVARLTADGALDARFGSGGVKVLDLGLASVATDLALGPNGSIYVGGAADTDAFVARLSRRGEPMPSFSSDGVSRVATGAADARDLGVRIAADAGGVVMSFLDPSLAITPVTRIVRLTTVGTIDPAFGGATGAVRDVSIGPETPAAILLSGGRVLVVVGTVTGAGVFALDATGSDDATWGTDGLTAIALPGDTSTVTSAVVDPSGALLLSGTGETAGARSWIGARLTPTGALDASFATAGLLDIPVPSATLVPVVPSRAGTGYLLVGRDDDALVARRLRNTGALLDTFGDAGAVRFTPVTSSAVQLEDVSILPDGGVVALSTSARRSFGVDVWRYDAAGRPVRSFGRRGVASWTAGDDRLEAQVIRRLADGRFVVASIVDDGTVERVQLMRLTANGRPDTTFGPGGRRLIAPGRLRNMNSVRLFVDSAGRYVVGAGLDGSIALARVRPSGALDGSFGTDGVVSISSGVDALAAMTELDSGKLLVVDTLALRVYRLAADGSFDTSFGSGGGRALDVDAARFEYARADLTRRGDIVLLGRSATSVDVARLTQRGARVSTFGTDGVLVRTFEGNRLYQMNDVTLTGDSSVVLVGLFGRRDDVFSAIQTAVMRLRPDGSPDTRFSGNGIAEFDLVPGVADVSGVISIRSDRMLIGATTFEVSPRIALARVRS